MIRNYGKFITQTLANELATYSPRAISRNNDFFVLDVSREVRDSQIRDCLSPHDSSFISICDQLRKRIGAKKLIHMDLVIATGRIHPHSDTMSALFESCYLIPLRLPKHTESMLFEGESQAVIREGHLYSFNQHGLHGIQFANNGNNAVTAYLSCNLVKYGANGH